MTNRMRAIASTVVLLSLAAVLRADPEPNVTVLPPGTYPDFQFPIESGTPEEPNIYDGQNQVVIDFGQPTFYEDALGKTKFFYPNSDGNWRVNADHVIFRNITVRGGGTGLQGRNAATRVAEGRREVFFEGCTFEQSIGCGVSINDTIDSGIVGCFIQDNGQLGYSFARTTNALIQGNVIRRNNPGFAFDPKFVVDGQVRTILFNGKWHIKTGFEAGGSKGSRSVGAVIEDNEGYGNFGPGVVWMDIHNTNVTIRNNYAHHNRKIGADGGQGIYVELNSEGGIVIEGNYVHDNEGAGISIAESRNVVVQHNRIENDELVLRDITTRVTSSLLNVQIVANEFVNSLIETRQGTWNSGSAALKNITISENILSGVFKVKWGAKTYSKLSLAQAAVKQPIGAFAE
jgi:parallel beta-helix repeat protein